MHGECNKQSSQKPFVPIPGNEAVQRLQSGVLLRAPELLAGATINAQQVRRLLSLCAFAHMKLGFSFGLHPGPVGGGGEGGISLEQLRLA
jgi:hypothetical protein